MSSKRKRRRISTQEQVQCNRNNVQRRAGSTRHEMNRQICPQSQPVSPKLLSEQARMLMDISCCVYCGAVATSEDHLEPLVVNGLPSGLISTALDMVPCCSWCNSSKGSHHWRHHMDRLMKKQRHAHDHVRRVEWLDKYDAWRSTHAQRWDVESNAATVARLNDMVNDAHAFMQQQINKAVRDMHGSRAIVVHDRGTCMDWSSIVQQLLKRHA